MSIPSKKYFLFIDESGDHGLVTLDASFPVFLLCGLLTSEDNYSDLKNNINLIKNTFWGKKEVILHSRDIRKCEKEFQILFNLELKSEFYIPYVAGRFHELGLGKVKVIPTNAKWFGVTYKEDAPGVQQSVDELVAAAEAGTGELVVQALGLGAGQLIDSTHGLLRGCRLAALPALIGLERHHAQRRQGRVIGTTRGAPLANAASAAATPQQAAQ